MDKKFAMVGGDFRNKSLVELLIQKGYATNAFALGDMDCATLELAVKDADVIIAPIPFTNDGKHLHTPLHDDHLLISDFFKCIPKHAIVMGGKVDSCIQDLADVFQIKVVDILKREDFAVQNAIPTAEGAMGIAISQTFVTLNAERVVVLGYGRIGKILCQMLKGFGADLVVVTRNHVEKSAAMGFGIPTMDYTKFYEALSEAKVVFNTVPCKVIAKKELLHMKKDALIIDLASSPGGVDFDEARNQGIRTVWALSLPGKVAPETSARILRDTILNLLDELDGNK